MFSTWIYNEGYTKADLFLKLKRPRLPETVIEVLTEAEIKQIMACISPDTFTGSRLYSCYTNHLYNHKPDYRYT